MRTRHKVLLNPVNDPVLCVQPQPLYHLRRGHRDEVGLGVLLLDVPVQLVLSRVGLVAEAAGPGLQAHVGNLVAA